MNTLEEVLDRLQQAQPPDDETGPAEPVVTMELAGLAAKLLRQLPEPGHTLWIDLDNATTARDAELAEPESQAQLRLWSTVVRALYWHKKQHRQYYIEDLNDAVVLATQTDDSVKLRGMYGEITPVLQELLRQARLGP